MSCVCVVRRVREVWGAHRREAVVAETVNGFPISGQRVEFLQGPDERSCWNFLAGIEIGETRKWR